MKPESNVFGLLLWLFLKLSRVLSTEVADGYTVHTVAKFSTSRELVHLTRSPMYAKELIKGRLRS